jgi:hypothetical protein
MTLAEERNAAWPNTAPAARVSPDVVELIRRMATENRLWGTERIRGRAPQAWDLRRETHAPTAHASEPSAVSAARAELAHVLA